MYGEQTGLMSRWGGVRSRRGSGGSAQPLRISQGAHWQATVFWSLTRGSPAVDCHFTCQRPAELKGAAASSPMKRLQHLDNDFPLKSQMSWLNRWNARGSEGWVHFSHIILNSKIFYSINQMIRSFFSLHSTQQTGGAVSLQKSFDKNKSSSILIYISFLIFFSHCTILFV